MRVGRRLPISDEEVQDLLVRGDLTVQGQTTQVDDIITTDVIVNDASGTEQFRIDGDASTPVMDYNSNTITNLGAISGSGSITVKPNINSGGQTFKFLTNGGGNGEYIFEDVANGFDTILKITEGGAVSVPNGYLEVTSGVSVAQSGTVRLPNDEWISARNSSDNGDVNLIKANTDEEVEFDNTIFLKQNNIKGAGAIFGTDYVSFQGSSPQTGDIRMTNDQWITSRNGADDGDINMFRVNTSDLIEVGDDMQFDGGRIVDDTNTLRLATNAGGSNVSVYDSNNDVKIADFREAASTTFYQGIEAGTIEAPVDSFTQLVDAGVTDSLSAGDRVGYTFAIDSTKRLSVEAEADGNGGTQNPKVKMRDVMNLPIQSSTPSSPEAGDVYIDDGTNTGSGNTALRVYDGSSWIDQN